MIIINNNVFEAGAEFRHLRRYHELARCIFLGMEMRPAAEDGHGEIARRKRLGVSIPEAKEYGLGFRVLSLGLRLPKKRGSRSFSLCCSQA